jgi:hypothetical protein
MKLKIPLLILLLFLVLTIHAQEKYPITGDFNNISFSEFVARCEKQLNVKFFYKEEWVKNIKVGTYQDCNDLSCLLDNIFKGSTLYFLIEESGNIVITNRFAVKIASKKAETDEKYLPPGEYNVTAENQHTEGNSSVEIGNPFEKSKPGNVVLTGYIRNRITGEPVSGVTTEYDGKLEFYMRGNIYKKVSILRKIIDDKNHEWIIAKSFDAKEHYKLDKQQFEKIIEEWLQ